MSDSIQLIETDAEFNAVINDGVLLVDFFATWCRPCRMQLSILDQIAPDFIGKAKIIKVDTDKVKSIAQEWGVQSIPTLYVVKNGQRVQDFVGVQQAETLKAALEAALA